MYNYWVRQSEKEVLAGEIKAHLRQKYGMCPSSKYLPQMGHDIAEYLKAHNVVGFQVLYNLNVQTGEILVEVV